MDNKKPFTFIDLFSGLGGFHLALKRLGGTCSLAVEWKASLQDLYEVNFGTRPLGDITKIPLEMIPDHDLLTAGFPCQPFSKAGEQLGFECTKQGGLFFNVVEILRCKRPRYFILENVPNLLKHDGGNTWVKIQQLLGKNGLGYNIDAAKLSPHHFGIPQIRERIYIVGSLQSLDSFKWPEILDVETSIDSILDSFPKDAKILSPQVDDCLNTWSEFLTLCPSDIEIPSFPLWSMEWGATYPFEKETPYARRTRLGINGLKGFRGSHGCKIGFFRNIEQRWLALPSHARTEELEFPRWKKNFIRQNRKFYMDNKIWIDKWLPSILKFPSSLQKLEWNVHGEERNIWNYVLQFRASGVRVKRRTTAPSLIAMTDTQVPIIAWQKRYMTPHECAKLQCLDELKKLPDSPTQAFQALGNAVNSKVVEWVAQALLDGSSAIKINENIKLAKSVCFANE
ncbi:Modification methylase HhaI [Serratia fonticola]|uniref:DNA cytosine methyltransferase n=1 Tax=Serratia fonticola TaxID=47917 RepID=UPI00217B7EF4|nr:DNA cytosine methyltransferase [Serratia fonticola]CAI1879700.1 Modification methylase HhaI [Serratia fonticola]